MRPISSLSAALCGLATLLCVLSACESTPPVAAPKQASGAQLFQSLCASCHGAQGRGDGPIAPLLVSPPPDLTRIAQRHSGFFPAVDVEKVIDGRTERVAHGTRSMPVWGRQLFYSADPNDAKARAHADEEIRLLSEYVRSIQQPL
jgi:mono/diheme cytochrome c family protein